MVWLELFLVVYTTSTNKMKVKQKAETIAPNAHPTLLDLPWMICGITCFPQDQD